MKKHNKTITILGSTGSIGCNTVKVIKNSPEKYKVKAITANSNVGLLAKQAIELDVEMAVIADEALYQELKNLLSGTKIKVAAGKQGLVEAAKTDSDIVMSAIVGSAGLMPTMAAIERGARVALANKECLVCAGELMMAKVKKCGAELIPVDSEHSAIWQVFDFNRPENVDRIILTASGGPFRMFSKEEMRNVTPEQAVNHPNWSMGNKISVDSATMMNKGLEIIEAYYLFPVKAEQIDVLVHPESVIHSMVEYKDGSVLAQMGTADMCTPISVALCWPDRMKLASKKLDLAAIGSLTFAEVDYDRFPAVRMAKEAMLAGGTAPLMLNTANEVAVDAFLKGRIGFLDIARLVEEVMTKFPSSAQENIEDILGCLEETRCFAEAAL